MKYKIVGLALAGAIMLFSCGCSNRKSDYVNIYNRQHNTFDNVGIKLPNGYFYSDHDKIKIDEHNLDLVIHFSDNVDSWEEVTSNE